MDRVTAYYLIRDACEKAGLQERIGTHSMRKTFGYHHYQQFKDVVILQKIFNHSSPQITFPYIVRLEVKNEPPKTYRVDEELFSEIKEKVAP